MSVCTITPTKSRNGTGAKGVLFDKNIEAVFATHLARTLGIFCGILNQNHFANSHSAFCELFWFSGKCVFDEKMCFVTSKIHLGRVHFLVKWLRMACVYYMCLYRGSSLMHRWIVRCKL